MPSANNNSQNSCSKHASVKQSCTTDDNHTPKPAKRTQKQLITVKKCYS